MMTKAQVAILFLSLGTVGGMVAGLPQWTDALTPAFVGAAIGNVCMQVYGLLSKGPDEVRREKNREALANYYNRTKDL
jgi:hypothetical protein